MENGREFTTNYLFSKQQLPDKTGLKVYQTRSKT